MEDDSKNKVTSANRSTPSMSPGFSILKEGEAEILMHGNDVFYNKAQIVNRDLSIAVVRSFLTQRQEEYVERRGKKSSQNESYQNKKSEQHQESESVNAAKPKTNPVEASSDLVNSTETKQINAPEANRLEMVDAPIKPGRILEALAASGLRALRYAREVEGVGSVIALDNDKVAVEACKRNIKLNGSIAALKVQAEFADARVYMLTHEKEFDMVDIDPYGSPSVFLDSAVQSVVDGGLLMCTATDMAVLCGNNGEVCHSKYGAYPVRAKYCHEMALRILLASIESHANRYKRHIVPILSVSVDFYVRVFVRIFTSPSAVKNSPSKLSYLYQCVGCDAFHLQPVGRVIYKNNSARYLAGTGPVVLPNCRYCGKHFNMGGPIWSDPIHDSNWIHMILKDMVAAKEKYPAYSRVHGVLTAVSEELLDVPLYLSLHSLSATLKCTPPSASLFRYAVVNAGYRISGSHACALGLKTDAPMDAVWDIMRCWVKSHPVKAQPAETPGNIILSQEPVMEANFSKVQSALSKAQIKGVARFLPNPEVFWGPKPRAGRQITSKHALSLGPGGMNGISYETHKTSDVELESDSKRQKLDVEDER